METRAISAEALATGHEPVSKPTLLRRQLGVVGRRRWREMIMLGGLLAALPMVIAIEIAPREAASWQADVLRNLLRTMWIIALLIAAIWPFSVWTDESPARRGYHYSLPAKRLTHDLARVVAGAIWILAVLAMVAAIAVLAFWFGGPPPPLELGVPIWGHFIGGTMILYLLTSSLCISAERPLWWLFGGWLAFAVAFALANNFMPSVGRFLEALIGASGDWGVFAAATAAVNRIAGGPEATLPAGPLLLWLAVSVALLLLAASRHREATS